MRIRYLLIPLILFLGAFGPLLLGIAGGFYADMHGCRLHEGFPEPCIVDGEDIGKSLYPFAVIPWLTIALVPFAAIIFVIWVAIELILWWSRRKDRHRR